MAISSLIRSRALFSSPDEWRCSGELKPMPAPRGPWRRRRALGLRRRLDCARFRRRDFENSLTACTRRVSVGALSLHALKGHPHRVTRPVCAAPAPSSPGGLDPHIFLAVLVYGQMYCAKRAPSNLLLDQVLIDAVLRRSIILAVAVL
jgi:hypothetical protein